MKKLLLTVSMVSLVTLAACNSSKEHVVNHNNGMPLTQKVMDYQSGYTAIMKEMHKQMSSVVVSNNVSVDFMMQMIPHHQAAIDMSKLIIKYTNSQRVISLAKQIISEQENEIMQMNAEIKKSLAENVTTPGFKEYLNDYNKIMKKMHTAMTNIKSTNLVGVDYMLEMIPHHQAAIDMSKLVLKFPVNTYVKNLANNIITSQTKEIALMNYLIKDIERKNMKK